MGGDNLPHRCVEKRDLFVFFMSNFFALLAGQRCEAKGRRFEFILGLGCDGHAIDSLEPFEG